MHRWLLSQPLGFPLQRHPTNELEGAHPSRLLRRVGSYDRTATNFRSSVLIFYARRTRSSRPACRNKLPLVGVELNAMYLTSAAHDPRAFWIELGPFCKLYFLYLGIVTICILLSLFRMLIRLRSLKKPTVTEDYELKQLMVARLRNNIDNLCQLTHFSTLLFGLIFFLQFPAILSGFGDSSETGWTVIFHGFFTYFAFASAVFLVFLILHRDE